MSTDDMRSGTSQILKHGPLESVAETLENERILAHLRTAERQIRWIRAIGMLSWLVVLYWHGHRFSLSLVWGVYAYGVVYTAWSFWSATHARNIRRTSAITTVGDPLVAAAICHVTGGLDSIFYIFFYFTLLATAFRYGLRELVGITILNGTLALFLFRFSQSSAGLDTLLITLFYLSMVSGLSAMLANWAQQNFRLVQRQARSLQQAGLRLKWLLHRLISAEEDEKRNIAHELHDRMSGRLFNLRQGLERLAASVRDQSAVQMHVDALSDEINECTRDVRNIMNELQPTVLEELGFYEAAGEYLTKLADIVPFNLDVHIDARLSRWRSKHDAALFRILQESMLNLRKHADPQRVEVRLEPDGDHVVLTVSDDGAGFDSGKVPIGHYGLMAMRERAEALDGELTIQSCGAGGGTKVLVKLPRGTMA